MNVIYKTIPVHTQEKVALDSPIEVYFMIDMNKNTIRPEHIILFNLQEQSVEPVTFTYHRRVLKITPTSKLTPNSHYQLQILGGEKGIKDIAGRTMAQTYEVEFYTKDVEEIKPPRILAPTDLSVVREAAEIQLESIANADYYEVQISKSNTFQNVVWPTNGEKVYRIAATSVIPDIPYTTGTYYLRVRSVDIEGNASAWSPSVRYHYDGAPIIQIPEEEPIPIPEPSTPTEETVSTQSVRRVVLQAMSQLHSEPNQLSQLQNVFSIKAGEVVTGFSVKSSKPLDKSVHNNVAKFNGDNRRQIIIEFSEDIDPTSIDSTTCYVLAERN